MKSVYMDHGPVLILSDLHIFAGLLLFPVSRLLRIYLTSLIYEAGVGQSISLLTSKVLFNGTEDRIQQFY